MMKIMVTGTTVNKTEQKKQYKDRILYSSDRIVFKHSFTNKKKSMNGSVQYVDA